MPNVHNRVTIAGTLYHQVSGSNPTSISLSCTQHILSNEQVYARTSPKGIGPEWEPLSFGWVEDCFLFYIRNNEAADPKNAEEWKKKTILVGSGTKENPEVGIYVMNIQRIPLCIPPGMVSLLYPSLGEGSLHISSGGDESVKYTLFVLPR